MKTRSPQQIWRPFPNFGNSESLLCDSLIDSDCLLVKALKIG